MNNKFISIKDINKILISEDTSADKVAQILVLCESENKILDIDTIIDKINDGSCEDNGSCNYCQYNVCPRDYIERSDAVEIIEEEMNRNEDKTD